MNRKKINPDGVRGYVRIIVVFLAVVLLSLLVFFGCVQKDVEENVKKTITDNVERQSYHFYSIIAVQYDYLAAAAAYLGEQEELVSEEAKLLLAKLYEKSGLERVALIEPDGTSHYDNGEEKDVADRDYFKESMKGNKWFSDPLESVIDKKTRVILSVPVYRGDEVIGVLGGSYDVGALSHLLFEDIYEEAGSSLIVTGTGEIVAWDKEGLDGQLQEPMRFSEYFKKASFVDDGSLVQIIKDFEQQRGGCKKLRMDGVEQYLSYSPLGLNDWMLCYIVQKDTAQESYSFIWEYEVILMAVYVAAVLALLLMIFRMNARRQSALLRDAQIDGLTGAYNKKSTTVEIGSWLESEEHRGLQVFVMLDIDRFKEINDEYGHAAGDEVLRRVGRLLHGYFREGDIVGRIGGDEFAVLMKNVNTIEDARNKAEGLCRQFRELRVEECPELRVSCSVGLAASPDHGKTYMELYQYADQALYQTKQRGRDGWTVYAKA